MSTVAVLGAAGFIGSRTVETLHLAGAHTIVPVVRRPERLANAARFALDLRVADARDEAGLSAALSGATHLVHTVAGDSATILGSIAPVYRAATSAGLARIVVLSTASVHGQSPTHGTDETSPISDRQGIAYNNAKVRAERAWLELRRTAGVEIVFLRPGIVHGPRSFWTAGFADDLLAGRAYLVDGGKGVCNSIYVDNLVHAIELALDAPQADGRAYLLSDAEPATWRDLLEPIAAAFGHDLEALSVPLDRARRGLRTSELHWSRAALDHLPGPLRAGIKAAYGEWRKSRRRAQSRQGPVFTSETILLHTCRTRLTSERAVRELGYAPIVDFAEAIRRSLDWLNFAGYPIAFANRHSSARAVP